jgi:two-component system response regulator AtoC
MRPTADGEPTVVAQDRGHAIGDGAGEEGRGTDATVLLLGESGTGKEVLSRALHRESKRATGRSWPSTALPFRMRFSKAKCSVTKRGPSPAPCPTTGAVSSWPMAGTLFLDEVSELKPQLQAKLLRVLQERRFERVGGTRTIEVDVRIVAATNSDLTEAMRAGRFREDLYHRLAVFPIRIPPLRERLADIVPLATDLLARIARQLGRPALGLDEAAQARLMSYAWPGNVRELGNVLERAAILSEGAVIGAELILTGPLASVSPNAGSGHREA